MSTDSSLYCGQCGVPVASSARFCPACGSPQFEDGRDTPDQSEMPQPGVLRALVDVRFDAFVTPKIIGFFYAVLFITTVAFYIVATVAAFLEDAGNGALVLFLGPLVGLLFILFVRVIFESQVAQFKIAENTAKTASTVTRRRAM